MQVQSFLWVFQNYYRISIPRLTEKTGFQWLTGWEVCCLRCLKNNSWEREHASGTSSLVGFRWQAAENLQCWLMEEGEKCLVFPPVQREENAGFGRRLVTACRLGPRAITLSGMCLGWGQMAHRKIAELQLCKQMLGSRRCLVPPSSPHLLPSPLKLSVPGGDHSWLPKKCRDHKCLHFSFFSCDWCLIQ